MSLTPNDLSPDTTNRSISDVKLNLHGEFNSIHNERPDTSVIAENLPVYVRVRPLLSPEVIQGFNDCFAVIDERTVRAIAPLEVRNRFGGVEPVQDFAFSQAFGPNVHQFTLFEDTMKDAVQGFIEGQNTLVFAYGSSGSGKTYTMQGTASEPGVIPLTVQLLFECIKGRQVESPNFRPLKLCDIGRMDVSDIEAENSLKTSLLLLADQEVSDSSTRSDRTFGTSMGNVFEDLEEGSESLVSSEDMSLYQSTLRIKSLCKNSIILQGTVYYSVWVSFIEIYNEKIYDLLQPFSKKRPRLALGTDSHGNTYVKGVKEICVHSVEEVFKLLSVGKRNLKIASTKLNYQSSRSHCIFNIKLIRVSDRFNPTTARINNLSFCDLAGSERYCKTQNSGVRLKEAGNINTSLLVLKRCLEALRWNQTQREKNIVPFRDSKLTRLFAAFFTGKGKASMIVNISPSSYTYNETLNVLKFSALAKQVAVNDTMSTCFMQMVENLKDHASSFSRADKSRQSVDASEQSFEQEINGTGYLEEVEERDKFISELLEKLEKCALQLEETEREKVRFEAEVRSKLRKEFAEHFAKMEESHRQQMEEMRELADRQSQHRFMNILQSLKEVPEEGEGDYSSGENSGDEQDTDLDDDGASVGDVDTGLGPKIHVTNGKGEALVTSSEEEKAQLLEQLAARNAQIQDLNAKIEEMQKNLEEDQVLMMGELSDKNERIAKLNSQLEELKNTSDEQNAKLKQELAIKEKQMERLDHQVAELQSTLEDKENSLTEKISLLDDLSCQLDARGEELQEATEKISGLLSRAEKAEEECNGLQDVIALKEEDIRELKSENSKLQEMLSSKDDVQKEKDIQIQELVTKEACKCAKIEELKNTANHLQQKLIEVQIKLQDTEEIVKACEERASNAEKKVAELTQELKLKDQQIKKAIAEKDGLEVSRMRSEVEQLKTQKNELESELDACRTVQASKEEEINDAQKRVAELQDTLKLQERRYESACLEHQKVEKALLSSKSEVVALKEEVEELKRSISKRNKEVAERDKVIEKTGSLFIDMNAEMESLRCRVKELEQERFQGTSLSRSARNSLARSDSRSSKLHENIWEESNTEHCEQESQTEQSWNSHASEAVNFGVHAETLLAVQKAELAASQRAEKLLEEKLLLEQIAEQSLVESSPNVSQRRRSRGSRASSDTDMMPKVVLTVQKAELVAYEHSKKLLEENEELRKKLEELADDPSASESAFPASPQSADVASSSLSEEEEEGNEDDEEEEEEADVDEESSEGAFSTSREESELSVSALNDSFANREIWMNLIDVVQRSELAAYNGRESALQLVETMKQEVRSATSKTTSRQSRREGCFSAMSILVGLLEQIENISTTRRIELEQRVQELSNELSSLKESYSSLEAEFEDAKSQAETSWEQLTEMKRMIAEKDECIAGLEEALIDAQNNLKTVKEDSRKKLADEKAQHEVEIKQVMELKRFLEEENRKLKSQAALTTTTAEPLQEEERKKLPASKSKVDAVEKRSRKTVQDKENALTRITTTSTRRKPKTRVKKSAISTETVEKDDEMPAAEFLKPDENFKNVEATTKERSSQRKEEVPVVPEPQRRSTRRKVVTKSESTRDLRAATESPVDRLKGYVAEKFPKLKAAAMAYLSPSVSEASASVASPAVTRRKRKLYGAESQPMLNVSPPPEKKISPPSTAEKAQSEITRHINRRRQCR